MSKLFVTSLLFFLSHSFLFSQNMDNEKLEQIFTLVSDEIEGEKGRWNFTIDSITFICLTDQFHNRMRIISPITEVDNLTGEQVKKSLEANFHTALDIKYAISEEILWSVFIHPLKELTEEQVISAISQVYSGVKTFGTHYSSGALAFPTQEERKKEEEKHNKES